VTSKAKSDVMLINLTMYVCVCWCFNEHTGE